MVIQKMLKVQAVHVLSWSIWTFGIVNISNSLMEDLRPDSPWHRLKDSLSSTWPWGPLSWNFEKNYEYMGKVKIFRKLQWRISAMHDWLAEADLYCNMVKCSIFSINVRIWSMFLYKTCFVYFIKWANLWAF